MKEDQDPTSSSKVPVKVRFAQKFAKCDLEARPQVLPMGHRMETAYLAGFEKAKALIIDHVSRSIDERIEDTDYKDVSGGLLPSEVLAHIGE